MSAYPHPLAALTRLPGNGLPAVEAALRELAAVAEAQVRRAEAVSEAGQADGWAALAALLRSEATDVSRTYEWFPPTGEPCAYAAGGNRLAPGELIEPEHDHAACLDTDDEEPGPDWGDGADRAWDELKDARADA